MRRAKQAMLAMSLLVAVAAVAAPPTATAAEPKTPGTVPELLQTFGVANQAADIVLLVDTSGSMSQGPNPPYPGVQRAYRSFVSAASQTDFLSVVTFDSNAVPKFNGSLRGRGRAAALRALPPTATGAATDIGAALGAALDRLSRPDSNDVQVLLVLTDGRNEPGAGSPYPRAFSGPAWARLVARAGEQSKTHNVSVYGNGLTGIGQTDIGLVKKVFPGATLLGLPSDQLRSFFDEALTRARAEQLRRPVAQELAEGHVLVEVAGPPILAKQTHIKFRLRSTYKHLPVTVKLRDIRVAGPAGRELSVNSSPAGGLLTLPPGGRSPELELEASTPYTPRKWYQPEQTAREPLTLNVRGEVLVQPDLLLHRTLGSRLITRGAVSQSTPVTAAATSGLTVKRLIELLALAALTLLVLGLLYRQFLWLPILTGGLLDLDSEQYHPFSGKRMAVPGRSIEPVKTDGGRAEFLTRRGKPGKVYVQRLDDPVAVERFEIASKLAGQQEVKQLDRIVIGRARFALAKRGRGSTARS